MSGRAVFKGSALIFFWRVTGAVIVFVTQVLMARWMGAAELGVYVLAFSWFLLLATVAGIGLPNASIRFVGEGIARNDRHYVRGFVGGSTRVVALASTVLAALVVAVVFAVGDAVSPALKLPLAIAAVAIPVYAVTALHLAVANAHAWYSLSFFPNNFLRPVLFLAALAVAFVVLPALSARLAMVLHVGAIVVMAAVSIFIVRFRLPKPDGETGAPPRMRLWIRTGIPILVVTLFSNYMPELNVILLGAYLPSADIAVFNASYRIALLIGFGLFAVDAYISPQIATRVARRESDELQQVVRHATRLRSAGALAATLLFAVAGKSLLGLFGPEFVAGYPALMILTAAQLVHAASGPGTRLLSLGGHQDRCLYVFASAFVVLAVLTAWLAPRYGVTGAAVAAFAAVSCWSIWLAWLVVRHMKLRPDILSLGWR